VSWHHHEPVMVREVLDIFTPIDNGVLVDATVGGGGHAGAVLAAHPELRVVGLDQDAEAVAAAREHLVGFGDRAVVVHARFDAMNEALDDLGIDRIAGVLFDLGVSSHQLDAPERGFSYRADGPLDMRMDVRGGVSAAELVNETSENELIAILRDFGDERHARRIAATIIAHRPVATTGELAELVRDAIPAPARRQGGHPAKRTFQALRIAANDELGVLGATLDAAIDRLVPGGRGVVLTYHSGEDRLVKHALRAAAARPSAPRPDLPVPDGPAPRVRLLHPGGLVPSVAEVEANPRAKSARARAFERRDLAERNAS
jgi:16S rRNA (cytosine1402-N4)-methyltransferase